MTVAPVLSAARRFLTTLFAGKPDDLNILLWTLPEKQSHWFRNVDDAIQFAESMRGHDLYVGIGLAGRDYGPRHRCPSGEVVGIVGLCADLDLRSDAHRKPSLPESTAQALSILPPEFPASFVILTGNGLQVWWLFAELYFFDNDDDRCAASTLANRWHTLLQDNARRNGWTYDPLADLARVLRVPGTTNCKDPSNPKSVVIQSYSEFRYNPADLTEYLDALDVADQDAEVRTEKSYSERFRGNPLKMDLSARMDDDRLKAWSEKDERFKATWFRQRHDLKDQTQSGYDMALAHFGVSVGLSDQEIVDLIVHHRTVHGQQPQTKVNYYELTISKARETRTSRSGSTLKNAVSETAESPSPSRTGAGMSDREKIQLCKNISAALGIEVLRMVKVSGDTPLYKMDLAAGSISFSSVDKLISKPAVRNAIAAKVGVLIPEFRPAAWRNLVQTMLDACIDEDGGEELESRGAARLYIRQYLLETTFINGIAGQQPQDLRKPMLLDDQIAVCASDIQLYLSKARSQAVSISSVVAMLSAAGAKVERVRGRYKEQSRWILPLDEFDPADYASSMPGGSTKHA